MMLIYYISLFSVRKDCDIVEKLLFGTLTSPGEVQEYQDSSHDPKLLQAGMMS
jgi:hypothetical protein